MLDALRDWRDLDRVERIIVLAPAGLIVVVLLLIGAYGARHSGTVIAHGFTPAHQKCTPYAHGTSCQQVPDRQWIDLKTPLGTNRIDADDRMLAQLPVGSHMGFWPTITITS